MFAITQQLVYSRMYRDVFILVLLVKTHIKFKNAMAKKAKKAAKKAAKKVVKKAAKKVVKKAAKKAAKPAKKSAPKKKSARKPNAAFMKALTPSATLASVIGGSAVPRTQVIKKIWDYIKKNGLQDKTNKRMINADDKLKVLFDGKNQISMFDLAKIVSKHVK